MIETPTIKKMIINVEIKKRITKTEVVNILSLKHVIKK